MTRINRGEKLFFVVVALSALWVGSWTYFAPAQVPERHSLVCAALHARVIGAIYLSAVVFCLGGALARSYAEVRVVMPMIATWTGVIFLVSLLHLTAADYGRPPIWIWFVAYLVYPLIALWLMFVHRAEPAEAGGPTLPASARGYFWAQGIGLTALGALLLVLPDVVVPFWPWKLTSQLAQIYAGPVLCYGVASLLLARTHSYRAARIAVAGMLVFAVAVLLASIIHRATFPSATTSVLVWFASLVTATVVLGFLLAPRLAVDAKKPELKFRHARRSHPHRRRRARRADHRARARAPRHREPRARRRARVRRHRLRHPVRAERLPRVRSARPHRRGDGEGRLPAVGADARRLDRRRAGVDPDRRLVPRPLQASLHHRPPHRPA